MAESYRGLTIRIGGDTTKLSQALKGAERSASDTQSVLRKLNDAVKLDPSSLEAANMQMGAMASSAAATAMKLVTLRDAIKQVGSMEFDGKTVQQLSEETKNAQINANIARESYVKLTDSLAQMYTKVTDLVGQQAKLESAKFAANLKKETDLSKVSVDDLKAAIDGLAPAIKPSITQTEAYLDKVTQLKDRYLEAAEAEKQAAAAAEAATSKRDTDKYQKQAANAHNLMVTLNQEFDQLTNKFSSLSGEIFNFDNGNVSISALRSALENLPESIRPNQVAIENFLSEVSRLKTAFKEADSELEKANILAQFEQLTAEATKTNAAITHLVQAMANMKMPSELMRGMTEQTESAKALKDAYSENMRVGKEMAAAYKADPTNIEALAAAERAFAAAAQNANEGLAQQQNISSSFEKNRVAIDSFTDSTKSAQQQLDEAIIAQAKASDEMARLEGNIAAAELRMKSLSGAASEASKEFKDKVGEMSDETIVDSKNAEEFNKLSESTRKWREELAAAEEVKEQLDSDVELAKQRKEFEESEQSVVRWSIRAGEAVDAAKALHQTEATPQFNTSAAEQFDALLKQLSNKSLGSTGFGEVGKEIESLEANIKATDDQLKILDAALKVDPTNFELLGQKSALASTKISLVGEAQNKLNKLIGELNASKLDVAAIKSGTLAGKLAEAKKAAEDGSAAMHSYESTISELEKELEKLNKIDESKRTDTQKQQIEGLTATLKALKESYSVVSEEANKALQQMNVEVRSQQYVDARNKLLELTTAEKQLGEEADNTHKKDGTPKIDEAAFMQVVDRIAQAARRMGTEIVQSSNEVDEAYRNLRKTVQGTETDYENLRQAAIEFSQSSITSADTMLNMQALGGQLGIAVSDLEKFGKIASNLDIATNIDAETIALQLGQVKNVLGLDIEATQGFADALVRLGNNMPAQESAIMAVTQRLAAVAATANFSGDEVLAWAAAIASTGQRSEAAATAISNTISGIESAVAGGGFELKQFATIAGMSAEEFEKSWSEAPTETLRAFIDGLKLLKDSDESAIAALENMGITSVRQQQTLLNLTQTVDNLDKALVMSADAWDQIDDQYGKHGDAANEAQKKSEGFSGALAILQNNAQNLAASFGDSLVPLMRNAAEVLEFVTDTFNNLPDFIKRLIVEVGGLTIAFSTIVPMLQVFSKGITGVIGAVGSFTSIGSFVSSITGLGTAAEAAAASTTTLGTALGGPLLVGITAVVGGLLLVISKINEYSEAQETLSNATTGLLNATNEGKAAYDGYMEGAQGATRSVQELRDAIWEATEAQSAYADTVRKAWDDISQSEAQADTFIQKIEELTSKESLSAQEQGELAAAIKGYNALTGESVHVIDAQNGVLDTSIDQIKKMNGAWKDSLEQDQLFNEYADEVAQITENEQLLAEAQEKLAAAESDDWFKSVQDGTLNLSDDIGSLRKDVEQYESTLESLRKKHEETAASMTPVNNVLGEIEVALEASGYSLTNYGGLTDEVCDEIVKIYEDAGDDAAKAIEEILAVLEEFKSGGRDAAETARQLEEASKEHYKQEADAYKVWAKEQYNARKAYLDAAYRDAQRGFKAEEEAQKNSFEAQYNAAKRQYDREYNERKRQYDRQYDQLKVKLDREQREFKAANDAKLKELKRANDAEEREFKNATDAYLHELEVRYKVAVKTAEDETDVRIKAIDEQIRALKGQTTAEQNAVKVMKEDDKLANLQKDIANAKSRRKREEAEKKYNMYLAEVQADRNERGRKEQIDALELEKKDLKDALDKRKDDLKTSYDDDKYNYKTARDAKLDEIKLANDVEYDLLKTQLDEQEKLRSEKHKEQLDNLKSRQTERLELLKEQQGIDLQAMKDEQEAQLSAMKTRQEVALENMKAAQTAELQNMQASHDANYKLIKDGALTYADAISGAVPNVREASGQLANSAKEAPEKLVGKMMELGSSAVGGFASMFFKKKTDAENSGNAVANAAKKGPLQLVKDLGPLGTEASTNLASGMLSKLSDVEKSSDTVYGSSKGSLSKMGIDFNTYGSEGTTELASGMEKSADAVSRMSSTLESYASGNLSGLSNFSYRWGTDFSSNFASGIWSQLEYVRSAAESVANTVWSYLHFTVPEKGPLADEDKWGGDLVQNLIDGMRDREHDLARQAEKMARVMEEGFDPTLTVDAAYEALDEIGKNRSASLGAIVETNSAPSVTINLSMNLADVSIRSDTDIERLAKVMSQEMATQAARQLAGRLG